MTTEQTAPGHCRHCGRYGQAQHVVVENPGASGAGATVVQCPQPCRRPTLRRRASEPRTYPA
jgi:hypothetical protein